MNQNLADLRARVDPVVAICAALVVALLCYGGYMMIDRSKDDPAPQSAGPGSSDPLDHTGLGTAVDLPGVEGALEVAEQQVHGLLTLNPAKIDKQLKQLSSRTTGGFQRQFEAMAQTIAEVVRKGAIDSRGEVVSSALTTVQKGTAKVLVASLSAVKNKQTKTPTPRGYRFLVDVTYDGGAWLVSGIEFV